MDRGASLRLGGEGIVRDSILGGGGTKHFFLLILYNFKNIGGGGWGEERAPPAPLLRGPYITSDDVNESCLLFYQLEIC